VALRPAAPDRQMGKRLRVGVLDGLAAPRCRTRV
jgi:hypothetical protein